jgi:hypothetical protein
MKISIRFRTLATVISAMALLGAAQAKNAASFEEFEGTFKPAGGFVNFGGSTTAGVNATLTVKVPKSGKTATITISGIAFAGTESAPIFSTFALQKKSASTSDVALAVIAAGTPAVGTGKLNGKGNAFSFNLSIPGFPDVVAAGTFKVTPQGKKKKKLTLDYVISESGVPAFTFQVVGSAKVKPSND